MELQEAGHPLQAWIAGGWSSPTSMDCRRLVIPYKHGLQDPGHPYF